MQQQEALRRPAWCSIHGRSSDTLWPITSIFSARRIKAQTFTNLTANLPAGIIRPTALEFISNNGVDALLVGGLNNVANAQSTIAIADSDAAGLLTNWRPFGTGLPNSQVSALSYNPAADVLAVGTFGRGVFALYDVTSYFPQATVLQFGLADNDSMPDASFLTDGTVGNRALIKYGIGTLTIAGDATYTGGTTINAGTLQLGNGGTSGSILGNVLNNGIFAINRSDAFTFGGVISGVGAFQQNGTGATILTAANTYTGGTTINAGTLQLGNGGTSGSIFGNVLNNGTFAINRSDAFTFGGVISGAGAFQQNGTGTTVLTAANTYTGGTTINAGTLAVAADNNLGNAAGALAFGGGTLQYLAGFQLQPRRDPQRRRRHDRHQRQQRDARRQPRWDRQPDQDRGRRAGTLGHQQLFRRPRSMPVRWW